MGAISPRPEGQRERQYRFGEFTLDLDSGFLRRGGDPVDLRPRAFEVLAYLVERHGKLVGRDELTSAVWAGVFVTDNSLSQCITEIRRALGDDGQQMIRTVARRGYVFAAPVAAPLRVLPRALPSPDAAQPATARKSFRRRALAGAFAVALVAGALAVREIGVPSGSITRPTFTPITDFTDAAVAPALSPDGRLVAFIRDEQFFLTGSGQIWVKLPAQRRPGAAH